MNSSALLYGKNGDQRIPLLVDDEGRVIFQGGGPGGGTGDMTKAQYDPNDDGAVLLAERALWADGADEVDWVNVTSKPASFPPEAHAVAHKRSGIGGGTAADVLLLNELGLPTANVSFNQKALTVFAAQVATVAVGTTPTASNTGIVFVCTSASPTTFNLGPASALTGLNCLIVQKGDGQITIAGTGIISADNKTRTRVKGSWVSVLSDGTNWLLAGDLA